MLSTSLMGKKGRIAVAVSGGKDSIALLDAMLAVKGLFTVCAVNVEHGIRGQTSKADSQFVMDYCQKRGVICWCKAVDAPALAKSEGISVEQAARILRYGFFDELLADGRADCIALAHHLDDQCETVLMRILRGTGIDGLAGIGERKGYIRPFLKVTRKQIEEYVAERGLPFVEDETNSDTAYSRNFLRNAILPLLGERWDYRRSISALSSNAAEITELLDELAPVAVKKGNALFIDCAQLKAVKPALVKHSIRRAVRLINGGVDFEEINCRDAVALLDKKNGAKINLAGGLCAYKENGFLVFENAVAEETAEIPFSVGSFTFGGELWQIRPRTTESLRFDISLIPKDAVIRERREGDSFCKFGGYTLPLGDFYTDKKVPLRLRGRLPVIAVGSDILVTAIEISEKVKSNGQREYTLCQVKSNAENNG